MNKINDLSYKLDYYSSKKKLIELLNLKKLNLSYIIDLLNNPNIDLQKLKQAKNTQEYLNYQINKINISNIPLPPIDTDFSTKPDTLVSTFAKFDNEQISNNDYLLIKKKIFEKQSQELLPKSVVSKENLLYNNLHFQEKKSKEEMIFKPSYEHLNGINNQNSFQNEMVYPEIQTKINTTTIPLLPIQEETYTPIQEQSYTPIQEEMYTPIEEEIHTSLGEENLLFNPIDLNKEKYLEPSPSIIEEQSQEDIYSPYSEYD